MAVPRRYIVDESCSSIYHCVSRTVRQAFLLAPDEEVEGSVDNHRRDWILDRIRFQSQVFAIDCISLAVMSNHLHLLLRILPEVVESWSAFEVAHRWLLLRPQRALREAMGVDLSLPPLDSEVEIVAGNPDRIARLRGRMSSLSWYMKEMKEWTARRVNREERRTGAFWEERFRSFRVLDDPGLLRCATYIDLNPVAAGMVDEPLLAKYTSIGEFARSALGPDDEAERSHAGAQSEPHARTREVPPWGPVPGDGAAARDAEIPSRSADASLPSSTPQFQLAARELWRRLLEAPQARTRHGAEPLDDARSSSDPTGGLADFIASFDGMSFHPAVPARREPHHPRGVASDDENIFAVSVLQPIESETESAEEVGAADTAMPGSEGDAPDPAAATARAARRDFRPVITVREARHRRRPPNPAVHEIKLGDYLRRLCTLAAIAQERGLAKCAGRHLRRSRAEIEAALGREADDRGMATLLEALFGGSDVAPGERIGMLAELISGARLFGTAVGSRAALAAEALRRGRSKVVMAFRSESRRTRARATSTDGGPAVPRAG